MLVIETKTFTHENRLIITLDSLLSIFRFYGNVLINKVTGNFHITAGKSLPMRGGHAHLSFLGDFRYNFSHRINHFSFGDMKVGFINILDGNELVTDEEGELPYLFGFHRFSLLCIQDTMFTLVCLILEIDHLPNFHEICMNAFEFEILSYRVFHPPCQGTVLLYTQMITSLASSLSIPKNSIMNVTCNFVIGTYRTQYGSCCCYKSPQFSD